ncbi:MAG: hypothetical protein IJK62_01870 [Bacteroidales bacterium]|nr:hypothetical protein [Bacteroidales bacterium]
MIDIGSIFPLYEIDLKASRFEIVEIPNEKKIFYSLCREALYAIAKYNSTSEKIVLLPAYTCDTLITPFKELGWTCYYYPVDLQLRIDVKESVRLYNMCHAALIVVHPYCGKDLSNEEINFLEAIHNRGCKIVVDLTQCIFSVQRLNCVDYYIGSYRKWFAIPDGGFLEPKDESEIFDTGLTNNEDFVSLQYDAMYLRGLYFLNGNEIVKDISRRLNKKAERMIDTNIIPHRMSLFSYRLLNAEDVQKNQSKRFANYKYLLDNLIKVNKCKIVCSNMYEVTSAPLYFMFYSENRSNLQKKLAEQHIYAPILWPVVYDEVLVDDTTKFIYENILAIPIDQRYDEKDMEKIVELIEKLS